MREPYDWLNEVNGFVGHVTQLNEFDAEREKYPIGFAPSKGSARIGGRKAGSWPKVPRFDRRAG